MREGLLDGTAHVTVACALPTEAEIVAGEDGVDKIIGVLSNLRKYFK